MLYIGRMSAPLVLLHASVSAPKQSNVQLNHLRALASTLSLLHLQRAKMHFLSRTHDGNPQAPFILDTIRDGSSAPLGKVRGREGHILFRRCGSVVHPRNGIRAICA